MLIPLPNARLSHGLFKPPRAVKFLILTNILVFAYQLYAHYRGIDLTVAYGAIPVRIVHLDSFLPPLPHFFHKTLITSLFLHDAYILQGGFIHLIGNMLYLSAFGPNLERIIGSLKFLLFYLLCGVLAALFYVVSHHTSDVPLIGASGAISGVMGAHFVVCPKARIRCLFLIYIISLSASVVLVPWILVQLFNASFSYPDTPVAWLAHIGGFGAGIFLMWKFPRIWFRPKYERFKFQPDFR